MKQHRGLKSNLGEAGRGEEGGREMEWRGRVEAGSDRGKGLGFLRIAEGFSKPRRSTGGEERGSAKRCRKQPWRSKFCCLC